MFSIPIFYSPGVQTSMEVFIMAILEKKMLSYHGELAMVAESL